MNFFSQRRLGQRLAWGFGTVLALLLGIAALSLIGMQNLNRTLQEVVIQGGHRTAAVVGMERSAYRFMSSLRDIRGSELSDSEAMMKRLRQDWDTYLSKEKAAKESLPANDANVAALFDQVGQRARAVHEVIPLGEKESGGRGEPAVFFAISLALGQDAAAWNTKYHQWSEGLVALSAWDDRAKEASVADASATADGAKKVVVAGSLIALLFGALTGWRITRDVTRGFSATVQATERMARHDLSMPVETGFNGELGVLARSLELMRVAQHELAQGVRQACGGIATASAEIAQGSQDLAHVVRKNQLQRPAQARVHDDQQHEHPEPDCRDQRCKQGAYRQRCANCQRLLHQAGEALRDMAVAKTFADHRAIFRLR